MGKINKIASVSAIVLLYTISFTSSASAGYFNPSNWLIPKNESVSKIGLFKDPSQQNGKTSSNESTDPISEYEVIHESVRQVTAYNVGDPYQNDSTPCIGAYTKVNLCEEVEKGVRVCAANFVPKQTILRIFTKDGESFECIVWDRMNSRFSSRVDIAMNYSEKTQARQFGLQVLKVQILADK